VSAGHPVPVPVASRHRARPPHQPVHPSRYALGITASGQVASVFRTCRLPAHTDGDEPALRLDLDLDRLTDELATRVAAEVADRIASQAPSPWMAMDEAIAYTRIPAGTFRKWVAAGRIPAHGGRRKLFHRDELDAALGCEPASAAGRIVGRSESRREGDQGRGDRSRGGQAPVRADTWIEVIRGPHADLLKRQRLGGLHASRTEFPRRRARRSCWRPGSRRRVRRLPARAQGTTASSSQRRRSTTCPARISSQVGLTPFSRNNDQADRRFQGPDRRSPLGIEEKSR